MVTKTEQPPTSWDKTEEELQEDAKITSLQKKGFRVSWFITIGIFILFGGITLVGFLLITLEQPQQSSTSKPNSAATPTTDQDATNITGAIELYNTCASKIPPQSESPSSIITLSNSFPGFYFKIASDAPSSYSEWLTCVLNNSGDATGIRNATEDTIIDEGGFSVFMTSRSLVKEYQDEGIFFNRGANLLSVAGWGCSGLYEKEYTGTGVFMEMDEETQMLSMTLPPSSFNRAYLMSCVHTLVGLPDTIFKRMQSTSRASGKMQSDNWGNYAIAWQVLSDRTLLEIIYQKTSTTENNPSSSI